MHALNRYEYVPLFWSRAEGGLLLGTEADGCREQDRDVTAHDFRQHIAPLLQEIATLAGLEESKQEMVVHAIAMPGTTMEARIGDEGGVPAPWDRVRLILKAKGFGEWIEARRQHRRGRLNVGDVLVLETRWAQQYDQDGNPKGPKIEDQASADAVPRNVTIGFYGPLNIREGTDPAWIEAAEQAYRADEAAARQQQAIPLADAEDYGDEFADEEVPF